MTITLREKLTQKLEINYKIAPKKFRNQNNLEMKWSEREKIYIGIDEKGQEWIAALQNDAVAMFYVKCPNENISDVICNEINIVSILDRKKTCRKCNKEFDVKLDIPE